MSPNDAFKVIGNNPVFVDFNLSTEIQFSTDVEHLNTHSVYSYWSISSSKKTEVYFGSWHMHCDNDTCERSNKHEFEIKGNTTIFSVWINSFKCCIWACI